MNENKINEAYELSKFEDGQSVKRFLDNVADLTEPERKELANLMLGDWIDENL